MASGGGGYRQRSAGPGRGRGRGRGNTNRQQNKGPQKPIFEEYLSRDVTLQGLGNGTFIQGPLRKVFHLTGEAYVLQTNGGPDVNISGNEDMNRALHGDDVAIKIHPKQKWKVMVREVGMLISDVFKDPSQSEDSGYTRYPRFASLEAFVSSKAVFQNEKVQELYRKVPGASDVGNSPRILQKRMESIPQAMLKPNGKVVHILKQNHGRVFIGYLRNQKNKNQKWCQLVPAEKWSPFLMIPMEDSLCPADLFDREEKYKNILYSAKIINWNETSITPKGQLQLKLGRSGDIDVETHKMLFESDLDLKDVPPHLARKSAEWTIPTDELSGRRDMRDECVFTVDKATSQDLDDAIHYKDLGEGVHEVGVHIADVAYFVEPGSDLDREAFKRFDTNVLIQKDIPMLPRLLSDNLCSLHPGKDRLCFSVIWKMNEKGDILEEWFGKTVVRSVVRLDYGEVQEFIENRGNDQPIKILGRFSQTDIQGKVLGLHKIASHLRKERIDKGVVMFRTHVDKDFEINERTNLPEVYICDTEKESKWLVEEFMILANVAVTQKLSEEYPKAIIVRTQPEPEQKKKEDLVKLCQSLGVNMDPTTSQTLQRSLDRIAAENDDRTYQAFELFVKRIFKRSQFVCTGTVQNNEELRHYSLNQPMYAYFSSPIRRYPDLMSHRMLAASIGYTGRPAYDAEEVQKQADHFNKMETGTKKVREQSNELFFTHYILGKGSLEDSAIVTAVQEKTIEVLLIDHQWTKKIFLEDMDIQEYSYSKTEEGLPEMTVTRKDNRRQTFGMLTTVTCVLSATREPFKWTASVKF